MKLGVILFLVLSINVGSSIAQDASTASNEWRISESLTIKMIADGVWVHTSWQELNGGVRFPSNGLVIRNGDTLVLVDTAWEVNRTEELLKWIDAHIGLPITRAIVTHFHADRMGGTPALLARGIPFVGHPLTRSLGANERVPLPSSIGDLEVGGAVTISNVEVFYPGPAHTLDNLVVWVPEAGVLFGSCAVRSSIYAGLGNIADADLVGWPEAIRRVQNRYPTAKIVIPGHGPSGDEALLSHTIGLFDKH